MARYHELENLRRSLAMLPPGAPAGLTREEEMALMAQTQAALRRLERLRDGLARLLDEADQLGRKR